MNREALKTYNAGRNQNGVAGNQYNPNKKYPVVMCTDISNPDASEAISAEVPEDQKYDLADLFPKKEYYLPTESELCGFISKHFFSQIFNDYIGCNIDFRSPSKGKLPRPILIVRFQKNGKYPNTGTEEGIVSKFDKNNVKQSTGIDIAGYNNRFNNHDQYELSDVAKKRLANYFCDDCQYKTVVKNDTMYKQIDWGKYYNEATVANNVAPFNGYNPNYNVIYAEVSCLDPIKLLDLFTSQFMGSDRDKANELKAKLQEMTNNGADGNNNEVKKLRRELADLKCDRRISIAGNVNTDHGIDRMVPIESMSRENMETIISIPKNGRVASSVPRGY